MDKIALDSDVGETWMMRRAKDARTETIAIYLLAFMVLFSLVLLMVWGFSISDTSWIDCQLSSLTIDTASPGQCATRDA